MFFRVTILSALVAMVTCQMCQPGPVDVMFVLSSDASISQDEFNKKLNIVSEYVNSVPGTPGIGPNDVQVGLTTEYSWADLEFQLNDHPNKTDLLLAIKYTYFNGENPDFGSGLQYVREYGIDTKLGGRPGVPDVVILLTDGLPADVDLAQAEAKLLTDDDVTVIALGGGNIYYKDLIPVASGCHYVAQFPNLDSSLSIAQKALALTCDATNNVPADDCECDIVADVVFLLDASTPQGRDNFELQKDFAVALANELNIGVNETLVSAVTYSDHYHTQFGMDAHTNKPELVTALGFLPYQYGDNRHPEEGLSIIHSNILNPGRSSAQRIVVVTATGPLSTPSKAEAEALKLKGDGATILSIGIDPTVPLQELASMASGDDYIKQFNDANALVSGAHDIAKLICQGNGTAIVIPPTPSASPDMCVFNPCHNGGTCVVTVDDYDCRCPDGYTGVTCDETTSSSNTPNTFVSRLGCDPAEVVFMIEYGIGTDLTDIEYEGKFIVEFIKNWKLSDQDIRVAIVVYKDRALELIHLDDYPNDEAGLIARIEQLTTGLLRPSGNPDLSMALDYVRTHSFTNARPNVPQVVIPIVHKMIYNVTNYSQIPGAGQGLKDEGVHVFAHTVSDPSLKEDVIRQMVTDPSGYYYNYPSFQALDNAARYFYSQPNC